MRTWWFLVLAAGCRQLLGLSDPGAIGSDGSVPQDATPATGCLDHWLTGPKLDFPQMLGLTTPADENYPFVGDDGLTIHYAANGDIYFARRASLQAAFVPTRADDLSSDSLEEKVTLSPDESEAFFASDRPGAFPGVQLWHAQRSSPAAQYVVEQSAVIRLLGTADRHDPHLSRDLLRLYFVIGGANGDSQLVVASRKSASEYFGDPVPVPGLAMMLGARSPSLTGDERVLVFTSTVAQNDTLYYATRPTAADPFSSPISLVSGTARVLSVHITVDGCALYLAVQQGLGGDLYVTQVH